MKINLPHEIVEDVIKDLQEGKVSQVKHDHMDLLFRITDFLFDAGSMNDFVSQLGESDSAIGEIVKSEAADKGFNFGSIARTRSPIDIKEAQKIIYVYFFTNDQMDAAFPDELMERTQRFSWVVNTLND